MRAGVTGKQRKRVWIDSQTKEEILRGIREAKDWSEYANLGESAYLRAKEDYLMGINFSRLLTLKYGDTLSSIMKRERTVLSIGRVMTCVLGMVVRREREIRDFDKTPFYRVIADIDGISAEWKAVKGSAYFESPKLYKENGFRKEEDAKELIESLKAGDRIAKLVKVDKKKETKNPYCHSFIFTRHKRIIYKFLHANHIHLSHLVIHIAKHMIKIFSNLFTISIILFNVSNTTRKIQIDAIYFFPRCISSSTL